MEKNLPPALLLPQTPESTESTEVIEGVPIPYKVPDYDDAIPVGKSLAIVVGIMAAIAGIFLLAKTSNPVDLTQSKNDVDFAKMNGQQQQQRPGQVAGVQTYGPPNPSSTVAKEKDSPTPTKSADATPTPTASPTPAPTDAPNPTNTPTPTDTPSPTPTETPTPTPTISITPSPSP